jgi:hypothetical protein
VIVDFATHGVDVDALAADLRSQDAEDFVKSLNKRMLQIEHKQHVIRKRD